MDPKILESRTFGDVTIHAVLGDLTGEAVDVVVNAANSQLAHGGGLAGAIVRRGGAVIRDESDRLAPVDVGAAAVTTGGRLPARWVVHAVGPRWGEGDEEAKLRSAVRSSLEESRRLGATSISMPAISTGIFGYPKPEGTMAIVDEILMWLKAQRAAPLDTIRLTAFDGETAELFATALRSADR